MHRTTRSVWARLRPGLALVGALLVLAPALSIRSRVGRPVVHADPAFGVNAHGTVPTAVMTTLRRACFDCHSDQTRWPWYSTLPVVSWLVERDVTNARRQLNFSRWEEYNPFDRAGMLDEVCERAATRTMPPQPYRLLHGESRLSPDDLAALCAWTEQEATRLVGGAG